MRKLDRKLANIDNFNQSCAIVFAVLLKDFPTPQDLYLDSLVPLDREERNGEVTSTTEMRMTVGHTISFLLQEGFVRAKTPRSLLPVSFDDVALTGKGLERLRAMPAFLKGDRRSVGEKVVDLASDLGRESARMALRSLFTGMFA